MADWIWMPFEVVGRVYPGMCSMGGVLIAPWEWAIFREWIKEFVALLCEKCETIDIPFGVVSGVGPRNCLLEEIQISHLQGANLGIWCRFVSMRFSIGLLVEQVYLLTPMDRAMLPLAKLPVPLCTPSEITRQQHWERSFVRSIRGGSRLLAVFRRAFSPPPALSLRPGPVHFPYNPGACTVYL